jgi:23S rRNA pseudouridine1911/1915/1917 synthase
VLDVLYEDADLLVVNKPAGLVCHPTKSGERSSLIGRVREYWNSPSRPAGLRPHLINRLDREPSGVVLIAQNAAVAGELGKIFEARAVQKEYLAIVHGHVPENQGWIDASLGKDERSPVAVKNCVRPDGAPAQTEFFVERRFFHPAAAAHGDPPRPFSLLRVVPRTGRKHQIRVHLAHLGHPVVGDKLYGGDEDCYLAFVQNRLTEAQRAELIFENHALHAHAVAFHWRGRHWTFSCEPEPWFTGFLDAGRPWVVDKENS